VSLPGWFPPVWIDGDQYIDAVYVTDANLEEAIRRGADELWIIWTVSDSGKWRNGPINRYFQIIEASANGAFRRMLARIRRSNLLLAEGKRGEFGRTLDVKLLKAEVPLHYLLNFTRRSMARAVDLGVDAARRWCAEHQIPLAGRPAPGPQSPRTALDFHEVMRGCVGPRAAEFLEGYSEGRGSGGELKVELTIRTDDVDRFIDDPRHCARASGEVTGDLFGGAGEVTDGSFNLFVDQQGDKRRKRMLYRLVFRGGDGQTYTLSGHKVIEDDPGFDLWADTTTLYTTVFRGAVGEGDEDRAHVVARGILRVHGLDFAKQLTTFRAYGPTWGDEARALVRFGRFFMEGLWDVYGPEAFAPVPF
jgi:hypothetical protein